jgi:putative FmdB family regulatory protein
MAIYQFKCECGQEQEVALPMRDLLSDDPEIVCPRCNKMMKRVFSAAGIKWNCAGATK